MSAIRREVLTADVVYSGMGTPLKDGAVVVEHENDRGVIIDIGSSAEVARVWSDMPSRHVGFAISPPPVNAHTHLDLSSMPLVNDRYESFIPTVIAFAASGGRTLKAARTGTEQVLRSRVRHVGDIVTLPEVMEYLLAHEGLSGVAYWEVISPDPAEADAKLQETIELVAGFRRHERPGGVRVGLTPHTPHTVSDDLMQKLARFALANGLPMQIHVEESPLEKPMHLRGEGELARVRREFDPGWQPPGVSAVNLLERLGVLEARPTLVHMVNVTEEEIRTVHRYGCSVVHCPRSNDQLYCGRFPWETYARHGVSVGIGTDSLASSPSLDVLEEAGYARDLHGDNASPLGLVRSVVKGGYQALGLKPPVWRRGDDTGRLFIWDGKAAGRTDS